MNIKIHYTSLLVQRLALLLFTFFLSLKVATQPLNKTQLPQFKIQLVNERMYTYNNLPQNQYIVLVYFSTTCEHCTHFAEELVKYQKMLKDKFIVMICCEPLSEVKKFYAACRLSLCPNLKIGTEEYSFIVQRYYNVQQFPFVGLYNKQKKEIQLLRKYSSNINELISEIIRFN